MNQFITKLAGQVEGVIHGFDRLVFRGTLRRLCYPNGMEWYLYQNHVLHKDYGKHVEAISQRVRKAAEESMRAVGRTVLYLKSCRTDKNEVARKIAAEQKIDSGPVCALSCVEPIQSFRMKKNEKGKLEPVVDRRQGLVVYHYSIHREFGWMNARIQTWFPMPIQICLNGREWLARQMDREGLHYQRHDNCFSWLENYERAQKLAHEQLKVNWPRLLDEIAEDLSPLHEEIFRHYETEYYWGCEQSEWATDLVLNNPGKFERMYPQLIRHSMVNLSCTDVMRFLGRKIKPEGVVPERFTGEVGSNLKRRREGIRVKFEMNGNLVKAYDKAKTDRVVVLRAAETTINHPDGFQSYRTKQGDAEGEQQWRPMRKGIADLYRRAEVSQACNDRFLNALAAVDNSHTVQEITSEIQQPVKWKQRRVRALRPWAEDRALLEAIHNGKFSLNGFRNRDLQSVLFPAATGGKPEARRRTGKVSRHLRMLRAHGLIQKVPNTHRYQITDKGRSISVAVLTASSTTVETLNRLSTAA